MQTITIYTQDIISNAKYICDAEGRCDLLGQILVTGYNIRVAPKTRTPACLQTGIRNFVSLYRGYVYCNTPLTLALLDNAYLPPGKQVAEANKLLNPLGINLVTESQCIAKIGDSYTQREVSLKLTELSRTSMYGCECGQNCSVSSLVAEEDDNNKIHLSCTYCLRAIPIEYNNTLVKQFMDEWL
jgi:hypothetical protein